MLNFLHELKLRNEILFFFSAVLIVCSIIFFVFTKTTSTFVGGINAWYKPFKFAISIAIYCSTMAWYCSYLPAFNITLFNWVNVLLFSFEIVYISIQASRGQESHFNQTTAFYRMMFGGMAIAAIALTIYAAYVGVLFLTNNFPSLPIYYVWGIRLALVIFVVFSFEGMMMGGRQSHTVGKEIQSTFLPFFKWDMKEGDLRIAHFIGMHALQVIPLFAFYVLRNSKLVFVLSLIYLLFAILVLVQALQSRPLIKSKKQSK